MNEKRQSFVLEFLDRYHDHPYKAPRKVDDADEKSLMMRIAADAKSANNMFNDALSEYGDAFYLMDEKNRNWRNGANTQVRNYFWGQLKYATEFREPVSISVFAEISRETNKARYRVSLEINERKLSAGYLNKYYKFLEIPIRDGSGLVYMIKDNTTQIPRLLKESNTDVKKRLMAADEHSKVQISYIIEHQDGFDDSTYASKIKDGVKQLIPYYNRVLGVNYFEVE